MDLNLPDKTQFSDKNFGNALKRLENSLGWNVTVNYTPNKFDETAYKKIDYMEAKTYKTEGHKIYPMFSIRGGKKVDGTNMFISFDVSCYNLKTFCFEMLGYVDDKMQDLLKNKSDGLVDTSSKTSLLMDEWKNLDSFVKSEYEKTPVNDIEIER